MPVENADSPVSSVSYPSDGEVIHPGRKLDFADASDRMPVVVETATLLVSVERRVSRAFKITGQIGELSFSSITYLIKSGLRQGYTEEVIDAVIKAYPTKFTSAVIPGGSGPSEFKTRTTTPSLMFFLMHGREARLPLHLLTGVPMLETTIPNDSPNSDIPRGLKLDCYYVFDNTENMERRKTTDTFGFFYLETYVVCTNVSSHCFLRPCVTAYYAERIGQKRALLSRHLPHYKNSSTRQTKYRRFWTRIKQKGGWKDARYLARKRERMETDVVQIVMREVTTL
ncbi:hypothetical protein Bbelb_349350, partial [Branchiostoma belcheri]